MCARSRKSLHSLRASLAGSRSGHVWRHSLRDAEVGLQVGGGGSRGRGVAFHAEGFCGGLVTLVVWGKGGSVREAALFLFVSSESICDSALECVRPG